MPARAPVIVGTPPIGRVHDFDIVVRGGRPLLVCTPDVSRRACTWDPANDLWTEYQLDNPWLPEEEVDYTELTALGAVVVDGRIVIGGGGGHQGFAQWDLETGKRRSSAWDGGVASATAVDLGGRPRFVVGCTSGAGVELWDPTAGDLDDLNQIDELRADSYASSAVAAGMLGGRAVVVANSQDDDRVLVWDIDQERPLVEFDAAGEEPSEFALAVVDGAARVVAAGGQGVLVGDPDTGGWDEALTAPCEGISCLDVGMVDGRTVAVTGAKDGTVCIWDLAERRLISEPFRQDQEELYAVRMTEIDGGPVVVSAGMEGFVRVWEMGA
jgi:WD40 repeat protein